MRFAIAAPVFLALGASLTPGAVRAQELVAIRPGVMCTSVEALAKLTLPNGSSRTAAPRPRPEDLRLKAEGGCIDIPPGAHVTVLRAHHNTSAVSFDPGDGGGSREFTTPNVDFTAAPASQALAATPPPARAETVLGTSARLGASIVADGPDWCVRTPQLRVVVQDPATLGSPELGALLQQVGQALIARRCPAAESVTFSGLVRGGSPTWHGMARAADGWALATAPPPANSAGEALNLDSLGGAPSPPPAGTASRTAAPTPPAARASAPLPTQPNPVAARLEAPPPARLTSCPLTYPGSPERAEPMVCTCDAASVDTGPVFGTDLYAFDSVPCRAARHAGALGAEGGTAAFMPVLGQRDLAGSDRNGIDSGEERGVRAAFRVREAEPEVVAFISDVVARDSDPALRIAIQAPDGRQLVADPVPPPSITDVSTQVPVPGITLSLPAADAVSLPIPPAPLGGGLPSIPWLPSQAQSPG